MAVYITINYLEADDPTVQGAEWLSSIIAQQQGHEEASRFKDQFQKLQAEATNSRSFDQGAIFDLFMSHCEDLFSAISEAPQARGEDRAKEVESFIALLLSMLEGMESMELLDTSTQRLCTIFSNSVEQHPELRLRALQMLYNTFINVFDFKYRIFKCIADYAAKAGLFDQVLPYLEYLDAWMLEWEKSGKVSVEDKRALFVDLSSYMRALGKRVDAFLYLKRRTQLYQGEPQKKLAEEQVMAPTVQLIKDAVQLPTVIQFDDLLELDAVKALKKGKHAGLVDLCGVFLSGDVNELHAFKKKNPKLFEEYDLSFEDAMSKIRLLTLATLVHGKSEIDLAEVAAALEESEDNVERWVVRALSEGVIDGRIDQLNHKVLVKSAFQRQFGATEWEFLDNKLTQWTENLEKVISFIVDQKKRRGEGGAPAAAEKS